MAELDQIKQGLQILGVGNLMAQNISLLKPLFKMKTYVSAAAFIDFFEIFWSVCGETRDKEEGVILAWTEYIMNIEGKCH